MCQSVSSLARDIIVTEPQAENNKNKMGTKQQKKQIII